MVKIYVEAARASNPSSRNLKNFLAPALIISSLNNSPDILQFLLLNGADADTRAKDGYGVTGLHIAATNNFEEIARLFIAANADLNIVEDRYKRTPLISACLRNATEVALMLIENKAKVDITDKDQNRALATATELSNVELVRALIEGGANVNAPGSAKMPPVEVGMKPCCIEV